MPFLPELGCLATYVGYAKSGINITTLVIQDSAFLLPSTASASSVAVLLVVPGKTRPVM